MFPSHTPHIENVVLIGKKMKAELDKNLWTAVNQEAILDGIWVGS